MPMYYPKRSAIELRMCTEENQEDIRAWVDIGDCPCDSCQSLRDAFADGSSPVLGMYYDKGGLYYSANEVKRNYDHIEEVD